MTDVYRIPSARVVLLNSLLEVFYLKTRFFWDKELSKM